MNSFRTRIKELIANPALIQESDLLELEQIRSKYPWFHTIYPLIAAYHKKEELYSFNRLLKLAALYAGDRSILRQFIEQTTLREMPSETSVPEKAQVGKTKDGTESEPAKVETTTSLIAADTLADNEQKKSAEQHSNEGSESLASAETNAAEQEEKEVVPKIHETEEQSISNDSEKPSHRNHKTEEFPILYDPITELKKLIPTEEKLNSPRELQNFQPVYNPEKELLALINQEEQERETSAAEEKVHDFLYWLDHSAETNSASEKTERTHVRIREMVKQESQDANALLENFIRSKPKMRKPKTEFFKAETAAKKSESDDSFIVSESLAKLHLKQAHFDKAIEVYEKLLLQNPNRKAYFAARIKEIKEQH